jgi:UDP-N-acetylmuramate--alanine ligase
MRIEGTMKKDKEKSLMQRKVKCIHFVGIGGIGMSGIAEVLVNLGYNVGGSDVQPSDTTARLQKIGAKIVIGHAAENIGNADVVVTSTAVKENNPEVVEAHRKNIPVIPRAEMLAELLKMKFSVAVSGSHGKTTTTSMISTILAQGDLDPTMVIGGKLASIGSNARLGDGEIIVAEADESDGSFLKLSPTIAVITNIDREHLDYYPGIVEIKDAFLKFANIVPFYGCTVICNDNIHVREIIPLIKRRMITYGIETPADYSAADIKFMKRKTCYTLFYKGEKLGKVELIVPGLFNVYNSLAAIAVARELNLDFETIKEGLKCFSGVQRRLEIKGRVGEITIVDD